MSKALTCKLSGARTDPVGIVLEGKKKPVL